MNINFLKKRIIQITKFEQQDKKAFKYALIFFSIATLITVSLLTAEIIISNQLKIIKKEQEQAKNRIVKNENVELQFLIFSNKLNLVKKIFEQRSNKQSAISYFTNIFPDGIYISGIEYDDRSQALLMKITSVNVFLLEKAFAILNSQETSNNFAKLNKEGLTRANDGKYTMSINITLLAEGEKANLNQVN